MATAAFSMHPFSEGERVHYRPLEEVQVALESGYLELETIVNGTTMHSLLRKMATEYTLTRTTAGDACGTLLGDASLASLIEQGDLDLHAYRWYPHRRVQNEATWLLSGRYGQHTVKETIDTLLTELKNTSPYPEYWPETVESLN